MNTPLDDDDNSHLRYAEYVLGVLDADARAAVAHEVSTTSEAEVAVGLWQRRLMPLADAIPEVEPAPFVWARIRDTLKLDASDRTQPQKGLWNNLQLWRWLGIGASAAAAALLVVLCLPRPALTPTVVSAAYMASAIQQDNGSTGVGPRPWISSTPAWWSCRQLPWRSRRDARLNCGSYRPARNRSRWA
jgi:anti-sigma-K factor RskA